MVFSFFPQSTQAAVKGIEKGQLYLLNSNVGIGVKDWENKPPWQLISRSLISVF